MGISRNFWFFPPGLTWKLFYVVDTGKPLVSKKKVSASSLRPSLSDHRIKSAVFVLHKKSNTCGMRCVQNVYKVHWVAFCPHGTIKPPIWFSFNCTSILHRMDSNSPLAPHKTSISSPVFGANKKKSNQNTQMQSLLPRKKNPTHLLPIFVARKKNFQPPPKKKTPLSKWLVEKFFRLPTIFFSQLTAFCTLGTTKATNSSLGGGQYQGVHRKTTTKKTLGHFHKNFPTKNHKRLDLENDLMSKFGISSRSQFFSWVFWKCAKKICELFFFCTNGSPGLQ